MQRSDGFARRFELCIEPIRLFKRMRADGDECIDERATLVVGVYAIEMRLRDGVRRRAACNVRGLEFRYGNLLHRDSIGSRRTLRRGADFGITSAGRCHAEQRQSSRKGQDFSHHRSFRNIEAWVMPNAVVQPRRLIIAPAADGGKRLLGSYSHTSPTHSDVAALIAVQEKGGSERPALRRKPRAGAGVRLKPDTTYRGGSRKQDPPYG